MPSPQTKPRELNWQRPKLYPKQSDAFFTPKRYSVCEATTKAGKTVGGMAWIVEKGLRGLPGQNRWWVAPTITQTKIAYTRIKQGLPSELIHTWDSDRIIQLPNKSLLRFLSGDDPDNLYGEDVYDALMDEASRAREESYYALRSTLTATRGQLRIIGNVKGRQNWAYRVARKAESEMANPESDWNYSKITCLDAVEAGVITAAEVEDARRNLPDHVFKELYMAEPSDDGGNPFGLGAIARCIGPLSTGTPMVWGIDLAKSVDWTVCIALDHQKRVCRFERWQSPWNETFTRIKKLVGSTRAFVDSTGVGDPIVESLQRQGGISTYEGIKFTAQSKQAMMEGLAAAIQGGEITFPDGIIRKELECYEYEYTRTGVRYSAPQGLHDDAVCALALAVYKGKPRNSIFA